MFRHLPATEEQPERVSLTLSLNEVELDRFELSAGGARLVPLSLNYEESGESRRLDLQIQCTLPRGSDAIPSAAGAVSLQRAIETQVTAAKSSSPKSNQRRGGKPNDEGTLPSLAKDRRSGEATSH
jgi:hypothetical protein